MRIMSKPEKDMLCIIHKEEPELQNATLVERILPNKCREMFYEFQTEEDRWDAVKACFQFEPSPDDPNEMRFDIHACKQIRMGDCDVIRYRKRNMVVSPLYAQFGGMSIDIILIK